MKRQNIQDERELAQRRKVSSEAYGILMAALLVSILLQQLFFNAPFKQYAAEFICFFGISIYILARYMTMGLDIFGEGKRVRNIPLVNSMVVGITVTAINGILNYTRYAEQYSKDGIRYFIATLVVTFISATIPCYAIMSYLHHLIKKKQGKIQKRLDDEEESQ